MNTQKILKKETKNLVIAIALIVIAVGLFVYSSYLTNEKSKEEKAANYHTLIKDGKDTEELYARVKIADKPYLIAEETNNNVKRQYYVVYDKYDYMYIVRLTDDTYNNLIKEYNKDPENFSYTLTGYIYNMPNELKQIIREAYNESTGETTITILNFSDYFGNTYLDETKTKYDGMSGIFIAIGIVILVIGISILIIFVRNNSARKKTLAKYSADEIESEIERSTTIAYEKQKIYLTDKYIISTCNGLKVVEYSDIVWMYNETRKYNGITVGRTLLAYTKQFKMIQLATSLKSEEKLIEIMQKIHEKNPEIMVGFTAENQKAFKEMKKNKKTI